MNLILQKYILQGVFSIVCQSHMKGHSTNAIINKKMT